MTFLNHNKYTFGYIFAHKMRTESNVGLLDTGRLWPISRLLALYTLAHSSALSLVHATAPRTLLILVSCRKTEVMPTVQWGLPAFTGRDVFCENNCPVEWSMVMLFTHTGRFVNCFLSHPTSSMALRVMYGGRGGRSHDN